MTVPEFYETIHGDYEGVMSRLMKQERVLKYVGKFFNGAGLTELDKALAEQRWSDAFREAHSMKGMALNLGFSVLATSSSELCEALRSGEPVGDIPAMHDAVAKDYAETEAAARVLLG